MLTFRNLVSLSVFCFVLFLTGCDSAKDVLETAIDPPSRQEIDPSRTGVNNFFVNQGFGSTSEQFADITKNIRLKYVRVLFAWTDSVQPSPGSEPNFGLFDQIVGSAPAGAELLVVVAHTPSWMANSSNWEGGNPRATWVNQWLAKVVARYAGNPRIVGYEVFNEPEVTTVPSDASLGLTDPANYFELLSLGANAIRANDGSKKVVIAATEAINQKFPSKIEYQQALLDFGAADIVDIWNIHYYSKQFERVVQANGVADFLKKIPRPIWVTESGERGVNNQLAYVETVWPFLMEKIPSIDRFYYYDYSSTEPASTAFGLRNRDPQFPVSDLYLWLKNR